MKIKLWYLNGDTLVYSGEARFEESWYDYWLQRIVEPLTEKENFIFFLTTETTDVEF